jgi:hypothetical protein
MSHYQTIINEAYKLDKLYEKFGNKIISNKYYNLHTENIKLLMHIYIICDFEDNKFEIIYNNYISNFKLKNYYSDKIESYTFNSFDDINDFISKISVLYISKDFYKEINQFLIDFYMELNIFLMGIIKAIEK